MQTSFDRVIDREGTNSLKWDGRRRIFGRDDILPMWVADMDFAAPPQVAAALRERAAHGVFGYVEGCAEAIAALADWLAIRYNWRIQPEWAVHTPGVVPALNLAVAALTGPGDKIVIQPPVYPPFFRVISDNGRTLVENPLRLESGRYRMDLDGLDALFRQGAKMLILCSPHNPVGRVWERDELIELGEMCLAHGVIVLSDEIHADLVFSGCQHTPMAAISGDLAQQTLTFMAPSKTFNVAGLSSSAAIIPSAGMRRKFREALDRLHLGSGNVFGLAAMAAAYRMGAGWLAELLTYLEGNRDLLLSYLRDNIPEIGAARPEGTFLAWLDCRALGLGGGDLRRFLLDEARIALNDGRDFGPPGEGFARLNFGCPRSTLREGLDRLARAVRGYGSKRVRS